MVPADFELTGSENSHVDPRNPSSRRHRMGLADRGNGESVGMARTGKTERPGKDRPRAASYDPDRQAPGATWLPWVIVGSVLVLLSTGGGVTWWLVRQPTRGDEPPPRPTPLSDGAELFERALKLDRAARVLDRAHAWVADSDAADDGDIVGRRTELDAVASDYGDRHAVGQEGQRLDELLGRHLKVQATLARARKQFVDLDPARPRYLEPRETAVAAKRVGVARLTRQADEFLEVLAVATDDQRALARLVPLAASDFERAIRVVPLRSDSSNERLLRLARFHAALRMADEARVRRLKLAAEQLVATVATNREATRDERVVLLTPAEWQQAARDIASRVGQQVIATWSPACDAFWSVGERVEEELASRTQTAGMPVWPRSDSSIEIRGPAALLEQWTGWVEDLRKREFESLNGKPEGESPLYDVSKLAKDRYLRTGEWGCAPELVLAGELQLSDGDVTGRVVLEVRSIVVAMPPSLATLDHNRTTWGLMARVITANSSFPGTLHRPRTLKMLGSETGIAFDPYAAVPGGQIGYLRGVMAATDATKIESLNSKLKAHMHAEVKKTQTILPAVTLVRLEQGLRPLVGNSQAKVDARNIGGAGLRALDGVHRLASGSDRLYENGAQYAYNMTAMAASLSAKGLMLFDSEIRNRVLVRVLSRDGVWLLSTAELCELAEKVLPRAGFYLKGDRKPLVPTDRDPDVAVFEPDLPEQPQDPKAPPVPVTIVEPGDADGQQACREHAMRQAAVHKAAVAAHLANIKNGAYKTDRVWLAYQADLARYRRVTASVEATLALRKRRLGESVKLRESSQSSWNEFALAAFEATKSRAGRPLKRTAQEDPKGVVLLPAVREALSYKYAEGK